MHKHNTQLKSPSHQGLLTLLMISCTLLFTCDGEENHLNTPVCTASTQQSDLNSFLWTLTRDSGEPAYFFGTIHVPYTRVWDFIPQSTKNAFRYADNIYFELDLTDGSTASLLANCQLLPNEGSLSDYLPRKLYRRLNKHMEFIRRKIPDWMTEEQKIRLSSTDYYAEYQYRAIVGSWTRMRPVWLMLMLNSLTESDVKLFGVPVLDLYLSRQAVEWGKRTGAIEDVHEQCEPLNRLDNKKVIFALEQTLSMLEEYRKKIDTIPCNDDLVMRYNCGDLQSVLFRKDTLRVDLTPLRQKSNSPEVANITRELENYFQQELLYRRNLLMANRIHNLMNTKPKESFFFAFGAGHFLGEDSVIEHLRKIGYTITHTAPDTDIQSHSKRNLDNHSFTHMNSQAWVMNNPYMEAMKKMRHASVSNIRHGKGKNRKNKGNNRVKSRIEDEEDDDYYDEDEEFDDNEDDLLQQVDFSQIWMNIEDASIKANSAKTNTASEPGLLILPSSGSFSQSSISLNAYLILFSIYLMLKSVIHNRLHFVSFVS